MWKPPEWMSISREELDSFFAHFNWKDGITLDMGCGFKRVSKTIEKLGGKVITLDIDQCFKPDIKADAKFLPFKDNSIDFLITDGLLEHFDGDDLTRIIKEEGRVCKKRVVNIIPKNVWWNRILEHIQGTPKVYWKSKFKWNMIFAELLFDVGLIGTASLRRLSIFVTVPLQKKTIYEEIP
jgi:SAM-dependent methyltransferase